MALKQKTIMKTISREIDKVPLVVDNEMVHELCLTRGLGSFCELRVGAKHVDKGRLSYV